MLIRLALTETGSQRERERERERQGGRRAAVEEWMEEQISDKSCSRLMRKEWKEQGSQRERKSQECKSKQSPDCAGSCSTGIPRCLETPIK